MISKKEFSPSNRSSFLDILRGFAVLLMIIFHFFFDLTLFRYLAIDFYKDPFWYAFPRVIVFLFMICVGAGLVKAHGKEYQKEKFIKRLGLILGLALIISIATYFLFPKNWIYFGTLHCIASVSLAALPFRNKPKIAAALGTFILILNLFLPTRLIPISDWLGIQSFDYIPFIPWIGVVLWGIYLEHKNFFSFSTPIFSYLKPLSFMGRHSLVIYITHQPLLFSLIWLYSKIV